MTPKQFWEDDVELLYAYRKAYTNKLHSEAHINGLYNETALEIALANAFRKKGEKRIEYPSEDIYNPYKQKRDIEQPKALQSISTKDLFHIKRKIDNNSKGKEEK